MSSEIVSSNSCPVKNTSFIRDVILRPPSDSTICGFGFMFGLTYFIVNEKLKKKKEQQLDIIESPLSTLFNASAYGLFTSLGALVVSDVMPRKFTPIVPIALVVSAGYLGYKLIMKYYSKNDDA